ncbi:hypothetical protein SNARM312S_04039 [Streptomyces narbonensis]
MSGVGTLARRVPLARPLTLLAQAAVVLLALTVFFAREQAVLWLIPGPQAVTHAVELFQAGAEDVGRYAIPAPDTEGIRLMLVGGVVAIGLLVDTLAVTFRRAAPAGLPLLALYSVAAGLSGGGAGWLWFLLAASGYLLLLLAEGRDRLSQWGRVFGGAQRSGRPGSSGSGGGPAFAPARTGRRIGAVAMGVAMVVPLALPGLSGGLFGTGGGENGGGSGPGGTISAVNPLVSLQDNLRQPEDREVLRYRTNARDTSGLYMRLVALDQFDGASWKSSVRPIEDVPKQLPWPEGLSQDVKVSEVTTNLVASEAYEQRWLPMPFPAGRVDISGKWRFEPAGRMLVGDDKQTTSGVRYQVSSLDVQPTSGSGRPERPGEAARRVQIPASLPADVKATAREVTKGARNDYEKAVKLQNWFSEDGGFLYGVEVSLRHRGAGDLPLPEGQGGLLRPLLLLHGGDGPLARHPRAGGRRLHAGHAADRRLGLGGHPGRTRLARAVRRGGLDAVRADAVAGLHPGLHPAEHAVGQATGPAQPGRAPRRSRPPRRAPRRAARRRCAGSAAAVRTRRWPARSRTGPARTS